MMTVIGIICGVAAGIFGFAILVGYAILNEFLRQKDEFLDELLYR